MIGIVGDIYDGLGVQVKPAGQPRTFKELRYAVVEALGASKVARYAGETEPPPDELPPLVVGVGVGLGAGSVQMVTDGVIVLVIVPAPEYARVSVEAEAVQTLLDTPV